jgi:Protein of unknown function (DUF3035)
MKAALILVGLAAAVAVSGCGGTKRALGLERSAPDEFRVITKAPLVMPPDYALRPPRPGEARPADNVAAPAPAVFGETTGAQASEGEKLLVAKAGATSVDSKIGDQVDFEGAAVIRKPQAYADKVLAPTVAASNADEQEATRRATGGAAVTIEPGRGGATPAKLPGL